MKNIAIICEYNPFHNGHAYQIDAIRNEYPDAGIVCIMSGNFTERAEPAILQKFERARAAVRCGADLVLELPFPYSCAGAEFFATAGVRIADSLGVVDALSFGSECGNIDIITKTAKNLLSPVFIEKVSFGAERSKEKSYAAIREEVYEETFGGAGILKEPNNILAIEYVKAIIRQKSAIRPITLLREGAGYGELELSYLSCPSAASIRAAIKKDGIERVRGYMPHGAYEVYKDGGYADISYLERGILAGLRLADPDDFDDIAEASGGLGRRICEASKEANSLGELFSLAATKKYTNARIRRAVLYYFAGVREEDLKALPLYTQLLGATSKGREILKYSKNNFIVLTKPAEYKKCDEEVQKQIKLSHRADSIYALMQPTAKSAYEYITASPYIE